MSKRKLFAPLLSLLLICALIAPAAASPVSAYTPYPLQPTDTEIANALDYLRGIQAAEGSIGGYADSAWAVMAIAAAGEDPHDWNAGGSSIVDYLKDNAALLSGEYNLASGYERMILAIVAACEDPSAFGSGDPTYAPDGDYLSKLKELHNGIQFVDQWGATDILSDDLWGVLALIAAGEPQDSSMVTSTVAFIKDCQDEDGGWSWATPGHPWYSSSDVDDTAAAIMALIAAGEPQDSPIIADALAFIKDNQDDSGGFTWYGPANPDWNPVNAASTTWAIDAIVAAGQDPSSSYWATPTGDSPVDFVLSLQEAEGSFVYADPLPLGFLPMREKMTSDAIVALLGKPYPIKVRHAYTFEDPRRGTMLTINPECKTFRFTALDGYDSGTVEAKRMRIRHGRITIWHRDAIVRFTCRANINRDFCQGLLRDQVTGKRYLIHDPRGVE